MFLERPAAWKSRRNLAAPPPAKKQATASGLSEAISVSRAWNSTFGKGRPSFLTMVPPAAV
ncbi:hypothetical protein D9M69_658670 [compost metagenome]